MNEIIALPWYNSFGEIISFEKLGKFQFGQGAINEFCSRYDGWMLKPHGICIVPEDLKELPSSLYHNSPIEHMSIFERGN